MFDCLDPIKLARSQFAVTALYHFLFVPLTMGLSFLLAIMETVYAMTGKAVWKRMTQFWRLLFGINFAMGVATGLTMEFQFGTNWAYYSHYVGDIFGTLLAIEGMMAFFLEATLIGLFFFGWNKISKTAHLLVTWGIALGTNFSALWILAANGWMQHPVGAEFNIDTLRMELKNFYDVIFNPVAQCKFLHTISAAYVTGSIFVMAVSSWYLLKKRHVEIAKRSMTVGSAFGLISIIGALFLGDESGYLATENQKMKIAAVEAVWDTKPAPAGLLVCAWPDQTKRANRFELRIPYLLGIIATRSLSTEVPGVNELEKRAIPKIKNGHRAYLALEKLRANRTDSEALAEFRAHEKDLGYGLLLKRVTSDMSSVDEATVAKAASLTVPRVFPLFFAFRIMVLCGLLMLGYFLVGFWYSAKRRITERPLYWKIGLWFFPLPWIANSCGWIVAEYGRQPWAIEGVLPTFIAASNNDSRSIVISLGMFIVFYTVLLAFDVILLKKYIKIGPDIFAERGA